MSREIKYTGNDSDVITKESMSARSLLWKSPKEKFFWISCAKKSEFSFFEIPTKELEELVVKLESKVIGTLPSALLDIYDSIDKSKYILDFEDNWDDEDSPAYQVATLRSAILYIINLSILALDKLDKVIPTPEILHGPDGSIDILWKNEKFRLLINVPENSNESATFYGDNYEENNTIEGKFELKKIYYGIMLSLICL